MRETLPITRPMHTPSAGERPSRRISRIAVVLVVGALVLAGCRLPARPAVRGQVPIMGSSALSGAQLAQWFRQHAQPPGPYAALVPVERLADVFVTEGVTEGVRGDIAFIQSIVETGWFRFGGSVPGSYNNFAGIGATGTSGAPIARFSAPYIGVRAQIQHLRRYADPTATSRAALHLPCVDPRFDLVVPPGKARTWNQMGNGNWATSSTYASTILNLYNDLRGYFGLPRV
jgi:hypothetical protein